MATTNFKIKMSMSVYKFIIIFALIYVLIFAILVYIEQYGIFKTLTSLISRVYRGFSTVTLRGILIGLLWAFVDGLITATVIYYLIKLII